MDIAAIRTIGLIGAGNIGAAVARLSLAAGYDVVLSNSRGPETLTDLVSALGPGATADTASGAATRGDLVVVTIPLHAIGSLPVEPLAGKVVVDTNNYYPGRDGAFPRLDDGSATSSGLLQELLPTSYVVKGFNHIGSADLESQGQPTGSPGRRALSLFGDVAGGRHGRGLARPARLRRRARRRPGRELAHPARHPRLRTSPRRRRARGGPRRRDPLKLRDRWFHRRGRRAQSLCRPRPVEIVSPTRSRPP